MLLGGQGFSAEVQEAEGERSALEHKNVESDPLCVTAVESKRQIPRSFLQRGETNSRRLKDAVDPIRLCSIHRDIAFLLPAPQKLTRSSQHSRRHRRKSTLSCRR